MNLLAARHHATKMLGWMDSVANFAGEWAQAVPAPEPAKEEE